jgi:hypothetical protein
MWIEKGIAADDQLLAVLVGFVDCIRHKMYELDLLLLHILV